MCQTNSGTNSSYTQCYLAFEPKTQWYLGPGLNHIEPKTDCMALGHIAIGLETEHHTIVVSGTKQHEIQDHILLVPGTE